MQVWHEKEILSIPIFSGIAVENVTILPDTDIIGNVALGQAILGRVTASSYILRLEGQDLRSRHSAKP
ncbi:hypothetical protein [uncultured Sphaerochaeta sp.]|uniref:hypothetical protein n=1 Tax=uncultured Sphaerochaeta sp. TaxID=886478 RepID=UPI002A0A53BB|nr:hypothetical protein [uncultured Sphaerochaeta sp.]